MPTGRQDVPFGVINAIFLTRIVGSELGQCDGCFVDDKTRLASFEIQFLILLTSVITLVYKVMHLRALPDVWREHEQLLVEGRQLADRLSVLEASAQPGAGLAAPNDSDLDSDSGLETAVDAGTDRLGRDADAEAAAESVHLGCGRRASEAPAWQDSDHAGTGAPVVAVHARDHPTLAHLHAWH
jgi:hypothetical protein